MIDIKNMNILIVDDMKSMRLTIRKMLQNLEIGRNLKFAENGRQALEVLKEVRIDLAILDWNMPVMNGFELLEKIRNDKSIRDLPIIMVTAEAERDIVAEAAETKIDGYLLKPLTLASLDEKIKFVVNKANNPDKATIHRMKAREFEEKGNIEEAIKQIRKALQYKPNASRLIRILGLLHFKINKEKIAEKCLLKAASVNRQDTITRAHLAEFYFGKNMLETAGKYYLEILSLSDRYHEKAIKIARRLMNENSRQMAMKIFSKVIVRDKKHNARREQIIDICIELNEFDFPLRLLEEAVRENPSNYDMVYKLGIVSLESGDLEKALNNFIMVDKHVRSHIDAKLNIARLYYERGKVVQADDYINQILRINPRHEASLSLRQQF